MKKEITKGNRTVIIDNKSTDNSYTAVLFVNTRNGMKDAQATSTRWNGKTLKGAEKFANKVLNI